MVFVDFLFNGTSQEVSRRNDPLQKVNGRGWSQEPDQIWPRRIVACEGVQGGR
jgi:hypothetical protein